MLRSFALITEHTNNPDKGLVYRNLKLFCQFIDVLHAADVPEDIARPFGLQYFLALHKDQTDDKKLRPITIGTNALRILGVMKAYEHASKFASTLWSF